MILENLYAERHQFAAYAEKVFEILRIQAGLQNPVVFISTKQAVFDAVYFNLNTINDLGYTMHVVTCENAVLLYVIDIQTPHFHLSRNGLILRTRAKWDPVRDAEGIQTRYNFDDFVVVTNKNQTTTMFAQNITTTPTT